MLIADLPQENELNDVKKQGALYGCRNCLVPKDQLTNATFNRIHGARIKEFTKRYGLRSKPGILSTLSQNHHLQTPHDAYYAVARKIQRLLEHTFNLLNENGKNQFLKYWKHFEKPSNWHRLPNPITHLKNRHITLYVTACHLLIEDDLPSKLLMISSRVEFNKSNVGNGLRCILTDQRLQPLLTGCYITEDLYPENIFEE
ncbi:28130_t:CDS:2, partial [Dentiscutata erythropus]